MNNKGITLISLIIIIISIIILASIAIFNSFSAPEYAIFSTFTEELDSLQTSIAIKRANGIANYDDENYGFKKVEIIDAPEKFKSFDEGTSTGYYVDLSLVDFELSGTGQEELVGDVVTFKENDVYIYDKNGIVYYVKGIENEGYIYFTQNCYVED